MFLNLALHLHRFTLIQNQKGVEMGNPMKYIKDLEAVGFDRNKAEAQVQMVLDALEGDLASKADFAVFQEKVENRLTQFEVKIENRLSLSETRLENRLTQSETNFQNRLTQSETNFENRLTQSETNFENRLTQSETTFDHKLKETEFRLMSRLGLLTISTVSIAVAILAWLIKV